VQRERERERELTATTMESEDGRERERIMRTRESVVHLSASERVFHTLLPSFHTRVMFSLPLICQNYAVLILFFYLFYFIGYEIKKCPVS
jgi:hypothetical protein